MIKLQKAKQCGTGAHLFMPKEALGERFVVLPVDYQSLLEAAREDTKTLKEILTWEEIEGVRKELNELA